MKTKHLHKADNLKYGCDSSRFPSFSESKLGTGGS